MANIEPGHELRVFAPRHAVLLRIEQANVNNSDTLWITSLANSTVWSKVAAMDYDYDRHTDSSSIPMLLDPDHMPRIETAEDLYRHWRALMGPLDFVAPAIWLGFIADDGYFERCLQKIEPLPLYPDDIVDRLITICERVVSSYTEEGESASVALLLTRPGSARLTAADRAWARALSKAAHDRGLHLHPLYIATDQGLGPIAPDDLVA